ncbi:MAG: type I restriction enzyme HsdR N-terminal domain-containing protein [Fusobacterium necrophorum]|nr:type I restriction enzyme HsdR N-terminal domain-containing protein [Fusobacterium necrophorum]
MDLKDNIEEIGKKIEKYKDRVINEEMTKTAFVLPFFDMLGYDTRNPFEFHAEFTADIADAKGEKVDYAILIDDIPRILIECKDCNNNLENSDKQLTRYFNVTPAKIGILTNGIIYKFYTDLEKQNMMDDKPFLEINLLKIKDYQVNELKKFTRNSFDIDNILNSAEELKYSNAIKKLLKSEFENPTENFITYILNEIYDGVKTQKVKDRFTDTIKKSVNEFLNDIVRSKLEGALEVNKSSDLPPKIEETTYEQEELEEGPVTTEEELQAFAIVKALVHGIIDINKLTYKDTLNYFSVTLDDKVTKWVCRFYFNGSTKYIRFPEINENGTKDRAPKIMIESINDLYNYRDKIVESVKLYEE